jgi:nicotinamidase-related amidase
VYKTALLIIDVQRGLFNRSSPVYKAKELLASINALEDRAREQGAPIVYVQQCNDSLLVEGTEN